MRMGEWAIRRGRGWAEEGGKVRRVRGEQSGEGTGVMAEGENGRRGGKVECEDVGKRSKGEGRAQGGY